jgi:hypothetical protein
VTNPRDYKWKYRGKNPLTKLHDGEPYFFVRGQDSLSSEAVQNYAALLKRESDKARAFSDPLADDLLKQSIAVQGMASEFLDWQMDNPSLVKEPRIRNKPIAPQGEATPTPEPRWHMYVWTKQSFFHAVAQALNVAEARELLLEEIGGGDGSCPEREAAAKWVRENQPTIFHRSNAEFSLTDSAELREQEAYVETLQKKIKELEARGERERGTPDAEIVAELKADLASRPDLEERWFDLAEIFCPHCKTDGWPTNDQHGKLWHLTPSVLCTAAHIWYLRGDTKTTWEREAKTSCASCGELKHCPLRRDEMGGYVCLTCIDKKLDEMQGWERGVEEAAKEKKCQE